MRTRTKIAVGAGLTVCVVAWLVLRPGPPPITASFVRYNDPADRAHLGDATIEVSNHTSTAVRLVQHGLGPTTFLPDFEAHERITFGFDFTDPTAPPKHIEISGYRLSGFSLWRRKLELFLFMNGLTFITSHPDFTVSIDLPPRSP